MSFLGWGGVNDPLSETFCNLCSERIHDDTDSRLCSNFKVIGSRKVGETVHCFSVTESSQEAVFIAILCPFHGRRRRKFAGEGASQPTSSCKISSQSVPGFRSYFRKSDFVRPQCMPSS